MKLKKSLNLKASSIKEVIDERPWRLLVVDDEQDVHSVTQLVLADTVFKNRSIEMLSAYSAKQARELLKIEKNIAVILLDVVMETDDAGLALVKFIRNELGDKNVRIILRTGQPGQAPEEDVIVSYDINDYKAKSELTAQKLFTTIITSLRTYETMIALDKTISLLSKTRDGLEKILNSTDTLFKTASMNEFAEGVLIQISSFLNCASNGILCLEDFSDNAANDKIPSFCNKRVIAATGYFKDCLNCTLSHECTHKDISTHIELVLTKKTDYFDDLYACLYLETNNQKGCIILPNNGFFIDEQDKKLLAVFTSKISIALSNVINYQKMISFEEAATTDFLTGLNNRRQFLRLGMPILANAHRDLSSSLAVAMLDVDFFKNINDTFGHDIGDTVLKEVATVLKQRFRSSDIVARYGGEEFCVIATHLDKKEAFELFDSVRKELENKPIFIPTGEKITVTISIGVTLALRKSLDDMLTDSDILLYAAKENGRNCVVIRG